MIKIVPVALLLLMALVVTQQQQANAIAADAENEANFQKFLTECKKELGLSGSVTLTNRQWLECDKALANADPVIQSTVFEMNKVTQDINARLKAMREGKCHQNEQTVIVCKGLDQ